MAGWGAEVIHVEPPEKGDMMRTLLKEGAGRWMKSHEINYLWEHMDRNKRGSPSISELPWDKPSSIDSLPAPMSS